MKIWLLLFFSFFSCKENIKKDPGTTTLEVKLADNLPFKSVKLKKFDPVYGSDSSFNNNFSQKNDSFQFRFNMSEPGFVYITDKNDIGVKDIFLNPGENFNAEIFWNKNEPIKLKIGLTKYPGDNILYQSIHDSVNKLFQKIKNTRKSFNQRKSINQYVETSFGEIVKPALIHYDSLEISDIFKNNVLDPQLKLLRCYLKNELIINSGHENQWKKFYADSVFSNPHYKFWCEGYLEYRYFLDYIYEVINNSKADDLIRYILNIENFYRERNDTLLTKIVISQGLISFSEKHSFNPNDLFLSTKLDSICKLYHLDSRKYNFHEFALGKSTKIELGLFDKIFITTVKNESKINLNKIINDTSKVYYIDYWASWCIPCIKALPYTVKLSNKRIPKLEVLFISTDKNRSLFLSAANKLKLPLTHTYNIIIEDKTSDNFKKLNPISFIPVYQLIFFYQGSWRIINAVSSEDSSLRSQIGNLMHFLNASK